MGEANSPTAISLAELALLGELLGEQIERHETAIALAERVLRRLGSPQRGALEEFFGGQIPKVALRRNVEFIRARAAKYRDLISRLDSEAAKRQAGDETPFELQPFFAEDLELLRRVESVVLSAIINEEARSPLSDRAYDLYRLAKAITHCAS